jgi:hypothetical protein
MERKFNISWEIEIWASSIPEAIAKAINYMPRNEKEKGDSTATCFRVEDLQPGIDNVTGITDVDVMDFEEKDMQIFKDNLE